MNGVLLLIPFFLIRFVLLGNLNKDAIKRAAHFPKVSGNEIIAYWIYQLSNVAIFGYLCFLSIVIEASYVFYLGILCYVLGLILCFICMFNFAKPSSAGLNESGLYHYSRNPMYVAYFIYFVGCVLLCHSLLLFIFVLAFQISTHWIILSEETWCINKFGEVYKQYMKKVRRYI